MGPARIFVGVSSATHGRSWENEPHHIQAIDRDHSGLVKFSYYDEVYPGVRDRFREFSKDSVSVINSRFINKSGIVKSLRINPKSDLSIVRK